MADNIARLRKNRGYTQEELAKRLSISPQAVSKWENAQSYPDIMLLPQIARLLGTSIDFLMGYVPEKRVITPYEERYDTEDYYWGIQPNEMCYEIMKRYYPTKLLHLLEIGCGEGKDAVFFARNGYRVTAFDATRTGIRKAKRLAEIHQVDVHFFQADLKEYRLQESYDIIYSSGVLHHMPVGMRKEIMENYREHTNEGGLHAMNAFVAKPFIAEPPDSDSVKGTSEDWTSGELFTHYRDWHIEALKEETFDCNSGGVPHRHCMDVVYARKTPPARQN